MLSWIATLIYPFPPPPRFYAGFLRWIVPLSIRIMNIMLAKERTTLIKKTFRVLWSTHIQYVLDKSRAHIWGFAEGQRRRLHLRKTCHAAPTTLLFWVMREFIISSMEYVVEQVMKGSHDPGRPRQGKDQKKRKANSRNICSVCVFLRPSRSGLLSALRTGTSYTMSCLK